MARTDGVGRLFTWNAMKRLKNLWTSLRRKVGKPELSPTEEASRLRGMTPFIVDRFFDLQIRQKILEPMMFDKRLAESIGKSYAAHAWNFLVQSLYSDQISGICALVWDRDRRTYSVGNAMRLIGRPEVMAEIRKGETKPTPLIPPQGEPDYSEGLQKSHMLREKQDLEQQFDKNYVELLQAWDSFNDLKYMKPMLSIRNKIIAHHELKNGEDAFQIVNIGDYGLKWGDPGKCLAALAPVVFNLEVVCRSHSYAEDQFAENHERWAKDLWDRLVPNVDLESS